MACEWIEADSRVLRARLSGLLTESDRTEIEQRAARSIARFGGVRCLLVLDGFRGWQPGANWGDLSFQQAHDAEIERIAVVGDESWRDDVLAFMAAPLRSVEIRYFDVANSEQAEAWIQG